MPGGLETASGKPSGADSPVDQMQVQMNKLTSNFMQITENLKREIACPSAGGSLDPALGSSPPCLVHIGTELSRSVSLKSSMANLSPPRSHDFLSPACPVMPRSPTERRLEAKDIQGIRAQLSELAAKLDQVSVPATCQIQALAEQSKALTQEVRQLSSMLGSLMRPASDVKPVPSASCTTSFVFIACAAGTAGAIAGLMASRYR